MLFDPQNRIPFVFSPDDKGGAGDAPSDKKDDDPKPNAGDDSGGNDDDGGSDKKGKPDSKTITMSQADLDHLITERLERDRKTRERDEQKRREKEEADRLAESEKWQELAQKHEKKIVSLESSLADLEVTQAKNERLESALKKHLESLRSGLPDHFVALLDKLDPVDQLEYLAENAESLKKKPSPKEIDKTPGADGKGELSSEQKQIADRESISFYRNLGS